MRITYIHQYFNTPSMPGSTRSFEMARRLVAMGHDVTIITTWRDKSNTQSWFISEESGVVVHWLPLPYSNNFAFLDRVIAFFKFAFASSLRSLTIKCDVIFATSTPLTVGIPAVFSSWIRRVPLVFEVRDLWPEIPIAIGAISNPVLIFLLRLFEKWIYYNSKYIIALSPGMKEGIVRTGYPSCRVVVIPNSCDNQLFNVNPDSVSRFRSSRHWLDDSPLLIYAGTFGQINGVNYFVQLARELLNINSDIKILLVGDGMKKNSVIKASIDQSVYNINLFIENSMPKEDMPSLFGSATFTSCVFIDLPEMQVNSANKFFDSLAAGKPVFLNFGGWMHDLVVQHNCGVSAWHRDIHDVAIELDDRMHSPQWLHDAGNSSRRLAETLFDRDTLFRRLERVLNAAMHSTSIFFD